MEEPWDPLVAASQEHPVPPPSQLRGAVQADPAVPISLRRTVEHQRRLPDMISRLGKKCERSCLAEKASSFSEHAVGRKICTQGPPPFSRSILDRFWICTHRRWHLFQAGCEIKKNRGEKQKNSRFGRGKRVPEMEKGKSCSHPVIRTVF